MKRTVWLVVAMLSWWSGALVAQVYESKDKSGAPVFSDRPTEGAKEVDLPPPNVADNPMPPQPQAPTAPMASGYSQLTILVPAPRGTVPTNTRACDVQVSVAPALRPGDALVVTLDGTALPDRYTSTTIGLTEQD